MTYDDLKKSTTNVVITPDGQGVTIGYDADKEELFVMTLNPVYNRYITKGYPIDKCELVKQTDKPTSKRGRTSR